MKTIYKYPIVLTERQEIEMPKGATLLSVQLQQGTFQIWAQVELGQALQKRVILCFPTGERMPETKLGAFLGTVQRGITVWHFFDGGIE